MRAFRYFDGSYGVDSNGCLTEHRRIGGQDIIVHYDDVPESDITVLHGIRCTTAVRTLIDIASDVPEQDLAFTVREALDRRLFTIGQMWARLLQPDMAGRPGALVMCRLLRKMGLGRPPVGEA